MEVCDCENCNNERFILLGCCDGRMCGCMGQPVAMEPCEACNSDGKLEPAGYVAEFADHVEYLGKPI